jgi:hypothetical protein
MSQFRQADPSVYETFLELINKTFPELSNFSFGLLFRESIKKSRGRVILAEIALPGKLLSYYAKNADGNPFDFLLIVDEMIWACARPEDHIRIIRHELSHVIISEKGVPRLIDHDFADFHSEVELNADDPMWAAKLCEIALAGYKQVKEGQADPRVDNRASEDLAPTNSQQRQVQIESAISKPTGSGPGDETATEKISKYAGINSNCLKAGELDDLKKKEASKPLTHNMSLDDLARSKGLLPNETGDSALSA